MDQLNIYDMLKSGNKKPYEYDFNRYEGQKVIVTFLDRDPEIGVVKGFNHYYTFVSIKGKMYACTNHNCRPLEEE